MAQSTRVLILSGPTREYLDPVRYISNASSGRQGAALAREALARGHDVEIVQGPAEVQAPNGARVIDVVSAADMLQQALARHPFCDVLIGAAAVGDFRPCEFSTSKHRRTAHSWRLELEPTEDILTRLAASKGWRVHAGFALETERALENGLRKLIEKKLDWIVVNSPAAIGSDEAEYRLLGADGSKHELGLVSKRVVAARLLDRLEESLTRIRGR